MRRLSEKKFTDAKLGSSFLKWQDAQHHAKAIAQHEQRQTVRHAEGALDMAMVTVADTRPRHTLLPRIFLRQQAVGVVGTAAVPAV